MSNFRTDNTDGFSAADLAALNEAAAQLRRGGFGDGAPDGEQEKQIADALTNAWTDGNNTPDALVARVLRRR